MKRSVTYRNYFVQCSWSASEIGLRKDNEVRRYWASTPIMALNQFHRDMQRERELDEQDRKKVLRPKLVPDQYEIHRLFIRYEDLDHKTIESDFDLPDTANPNTKKQKQKKAVTEVFDFFATTPVSTKE